MTDEIASELDLIANVRTAIQKVGNVVEAMNVNSMAKAAEAFYRAQGMTERAQEAKVVSLWAQRKAGEFWKKMDKNKGAQGRIQEHLTGGFILKPPEDDTPTLSDLDIDKNESFRWQLFAEIPEIEFQAYIDEKVSRNHEVTAGGLYKIGLELRRAIDTPDPSEPATNPSSYTVNPGEVWALGKHHLVCGDAYKLIGSIRADALISDPPYGIDYKPDWNKWDGSPSDFNPVLGDDEEFNPAPFMNFDTVALFGANYFSNRLPLGGWLCWDKRTKEELDEMFGSPFELAWYRSKKTTRKAIMVRLLHGGVVNADSANGNNEKRYVATQKPVALMETVIRALTNEEEVIVDPFAGSGSTLLACERSKRTCIAIEKDPNVAAIILQRWADETGGEPCRE